MKKNFITLFILTFFCLSMISYASDEGFVPKWSVGEHWTLEASYKDNLNETDDNAWHKPIQWRFNVRAIKELGGHSCYVIHVYPQNANLKVQAVLWLAVEDLRPLRVIDIHPTTQGVSSTKRDFHPDHPEPLSSVDSIIPYDMPIFPLTRSENMTQAADTADGFEAYKAQPVAKRFNQVNRVGGLSFRKIVGQKSHTPDRQYSDVFGAYRSTGKNYQVDLLDERSGSQLTQLWQEGNPWALSAQSSKVKVKLISDDGNNEATGGSN